MAQRQNAGDFDSRVQNSFDRKRQMELVSKLASAILGQGGGGKLGSAVFVDRVNAAARRCMRILGNSIARPLNSGTGDFINEDMRQKVLNVRLQ